MADHASAPGSQLAGDRCRVCGDAQATSPEHFIPKRAGNRGKVLVVSLGNNGEYVTTPGTDGYYERVLCAPCNAAASVYAQQYVHVLREIESAKGLTVPDGREVVTLHGVYPLRFIKQLILMFLCAPPFPPTSPWSPLQAFLRVPDAVLPPSAPRIYLYRNLSTRGRVVPCCGVYELATGRTVVLSEVSWPPLGVVFALGDHPRLRRMHDITEWGQRSYTDAADLTVMLPRYQVSSIHPLMFGNIHQVEADEAARLPMYLLHVPDGTSYPSALGAIVERAGYQP